MKKTKEEVEKRGLKLSVSEYGKEGMRKINCVLKLPGGRGASMQ